MSELRCPNCGSGNVAKTTGGHVKECATAFGAGFALGVVRGIVNSYTDGYGGRFIPMSLAERAAQSFSVDHVCYDCDCLFTVKGGSKGEITSVSLAKPPMPESIIISVRDQYIDMLRRERPFISAAIFSFLTIYCMVCAIQALCSDSFLMSSFGSLFCWLVMLIFLIPAFFKVRRVIKNNQEISICKNSTPREFKRSHRWLFSAYSQYN